MVDEMNMESPRCSAELYLGDDHGDGQVTFHCRLTPGHRGQHQETFRRDSSGEVTVTWWQDEKAYWEKRDQEAE